MKSTQEIEEERQQYIAEPPYELTIQLAVLAGEESAGLRFFLHGEDHKAEALNILDGTEERIRLKGYRFQFGHPEAEFTFSRTRLLSYQIEKKRQGIP